MAELGDVNQHARAVMTLAGLHARQGRYHTARDMLENALHVVHDLDSPYYTAEILAALGKLLRQHGSHEEARSYLAQARELYAQLGDPCATELTTVTEGE
jgi:tetratricopeptide (TPR) repeat protein